MKEEKKDVEEADVIPPAADNIEKLSSDSKTSSPTIPAKPASPIELDDDGDDDFFDDFFDN